MGTKYTVVLTTCLTGILLIAVPESAVAESPWPMFQHDARHTGRSPFAGPQVLNDPNTQVQVLLEGDSADDYFGTPVIGSDGTLYLAAKITKEGQTKEGLWAFTKEGNQKWFYPAGGISSMPTLWEPGNTVYVACGGLLAIDSNNGSLKWSKTGFSASAQQNLVVSEDGIVYFLAGIPEQPSDWGLYAIDDEGQVLWVCPIIGHHTDLTIAENGAIYFGYGNTLFTLNADGALMWQRSFGGEVGTPSIADDGAIYVRVWAEKYSEKSGWWYPCFHAVDPNNPEEDKWESCSAFYQELPVFGSSGDIYILRTYASWDVWKTQIHGFDSQGNNWRSSEGYYQYSGASPLLVDATETLYLLIDNTVRAFNQQLQLLWSYNLGSSRSGPLSLGQDGTLYIGGKKKLYAVGSVESALPVASFTYSPSLDEFLSGQEITFTASQDETIVSYEWSFKQGTMEIGTDEGPIVCRRFTGIPNEATDYTIILTVRDAASQVGTDKKVITVTHLEKKAEVVADDILG
ncbi:MAG: PKD domain-containing protein, partial [Promethearchaeota archaeon]